MAEEERSIFGEGGINSIFMPAVGGPDKGDYDDWHKGIRAADSLPMDTPGEIVLSAQLKGSKERQLMAILIELGEWQMHAPASLREMRIAELSLELRQISKAKKAWQETGEPWEPPLLTEARSALESTVYAMLPVVASEEDLLSILERERVIRRQIDTLRQEIARAQARGVYEDFSHLHQLYSQHDQWRTLNGAKHVGSPFFLKEAHDLASQTAHGFRWTHIQAVIARHVLGMNPQDAQQQRSTQGWFGGGRGNPDHNNQDR